MPFPEDIFPDNQEVLNAFNLAEFTSRPLYITGKAGTGKSTFLRHYCQNTLKKYLILAPTGIAAINAGGTTIHSFFGLPWRPLQPNDKAIPFFHNAKTDENGDIIEPEHPKRSIIRNLDVIIIDEISMVRPDLIDAIDHSLRKNGGNYNLPFGGKQIICIGDLFQLEPVIKKQDRPLVSMFYDSPFFFSAKIFQQIQFSNIELIKVYRQTDESFINLLNKIRKREAIRTDFEILNQRLNRNYQPNGEQYFIILCTKNDIAKETNVNYLEKLEPPQFSYRGIVQDRFEENDLPTDLILNLKVESQIMFVKNDSGGRWVNGTIGKVIELTDELIKVRIKQNDIEIDYPIEKAKWEKNEYKWNDETKEIESEIVGSFTQYPVKLAWAITIHKSQGLTFDQVIIDSGTGMFAHGQLYVALSRCTSFGGLIFKQSLLQTDMIVDSRVVQIAETANNQDTINEQLLNGLLDRVRILTQQLSELRSKNRDLYIRAQEKNQNISELQLRITNQSEKYLNIESNLKRTTHELEITKDKLRISVSSNKKSTKTINELQSKIDLQFAEIERLKSIKWYHKIVGVK